MSNETSTSDKVYDYIMEKIVSKEWQPTMKIMSENQLATELNVSRISVRHALEKLSALGLLEKKQGYGTVIKELQPAALFTNLLPILAVTENDIRTILEFRIHFESANIQMFMKHCEESQIAQLHEYYEQMKIHYYDPEKYYLYDFYFHNVIAHGTKNAIVISISEILHSILQYNIKQLYHEIGPDVAIFYHKAILQAIEKNDVELAALFMRRHLEEALNQLK